MREVRTEIKINAPKAKVWDILMDFDTWAEWNPIVTKAGGSAAIGEALTMTMAGPDGGDAQSYSPVITEFSPPDSFRWNAKMGASFLFSNDKILELTETESGTHLVHSETFSGLMAAMMWGKMKAGVPPMLNSMNEALKTLAEKEG